jgi:flagellar motor switch protein FliG
MTTTYIVAVENTMENRLINIVAHYYTDKERASEFAAIMNEMFIKVNADLNINLNARVIELRPHYSCF